MKIEVYDENKEEDRVLRLRLVERDSRAGAMLIVVDANGEEISGGRIGKVGEDGVLTLYEDLKEGLGLRVDEETSAIAIRLESEAPY
jgi:hypothetical protein